MLSLLRLGRQSAIVSTSAIRSTTNGRLALVSSRTFANESNAVATTSEDKPVGKEDESKGPDNSQYPNAPIRKFFEETKLSPKQDGTPQPIPVGRPWFASELRLKSFEDLHKLHFVLLIERNKLLNEKVRHRKYNMIFPSPERLKNIRLSMARLQTILTERMHESQALKQAQALETTTVEKPELTEAQKRWFAVHEHFKKPAKHNPAAGRASGGQKTKRKMDLAREFESDTLDYIAKLESSRENVVEAVDGPKAADAEEKLGVPVERPRWRNLSVEAQIRLREKQQETRAQKLVRQAEQSEAARGGAGGIEEREKPKWTDRPELSKLHLRRGSKVA